MTLRKATKEEISEKLEFFQKIPGNYCIICVPTKGVWLGTSNNIYQRLKNHLNILNRNGYIDHNSNFQIDWNNYGIDNFLIIACYYNDNRKSDEKIIQKLYKENCYNIYNVSVGTDNSFIKNITLESRLKMSNSQKK